MRLCGGEAVCGQGDSHVTVEKNMKTCEVFHFLKFKGKKKQTKTVGKAVKVLREISQTKWFFFRHFQGERIAVLTKHFLPAWCYSFHYGNICAIVRIVVILCYGQLGSKCFCLITGRGLNGAVNWPCKTNSSLLCRAFPLGAPDVCISCILYCPLSGDSRKCWICLSALCCWVQWACSSPGWPATAIAVNGKGFINGAVLFLSFK